MMRAIRLEAQRSASRVVVPRPEPSEGEVVVRVKACGICGSDLNAWRGVQGIDYPLPAGAPGHEIWGEIADTRQPVTGLAWNGLAEFTVARREHLLSLVSPFDRVPLLGEPLACAMNVLRRSAIPSGHRLAIVGFGYLAALIAQLLPPGVGWIAVSRRPDSRALAQRLGADAVYDFDKIPQELWDSFPVVIEAAGVQQTLDFSTWLTAYSGRLVIAGYHADGPRSVNMQSWNWKGIDVVNAHERQPTVYMEALREGLCLINQRGLDLSTLLTHTFGMEDAQRAFELAEARPDGFVKAVVRP
ncbi:MAG: zinc-binding dehydrogenase [Chloroflexi bacterium]|nr:zinc-binding dehydrogenase [Chloroflexota bacterium]